MTDPNAARVDDLDRAVVAALRARLAGDGVGLDAILRSVELCSFVEHVLTWTVAYASHCEGDRHALDTLLRTYLRETGEAV
jgi:hypothetical protein